MYYIPYSPSQGTPTVQYKHPITFTDILHSIENLRNLISEMREKTVGEIVQRVIPIEEIILFFVMRNAEKPKFGQLPGALPLQIF